MTHGTTSPPRTSAHIWFVRGISGLPLVGERVTRWIRARGF